MSTAIQLTTTANDPDKDKLLFKYSVNTGRITGDGPQVTWDLNGVAPGTYKASVEVDDGFGGVTTATTLVTIADCPDCAPRDECPSISSSCPDAADQGQLIVFTANVGIGLGAPPSYKWTVSAGTITSGQGTTSITVNTDGLGGQAVTATIEVVGWDLACGRTASCTTAIRPVIDHLRKFDEYGNIRFGDEKARLDNFAIQLQKEPAAIGYIVGYGPCGATGVARANRAKNYVVNTRGLESGKILVIDGGCMKEAMVTLWIIPRDRNPPSADTTDAVTPCPDCKRKPSRSSPSRMQKPTPK